MVADRCRRRSLPREDPRDAFVANAYSDLAALPPATYQVRLVVVGHDGNFVQPPYTVPFTVQ